MLQATDPNITNNFVLLSYSNSKMKPRLRDKIATITDSNQKLRTKLSFIIPGALLILGFIILILYAISTGAWMTVLSTIAMVMLSSFSVGALIGFIFGIPRTLQENKTEGIVSNSNLEQLSDWLTKIIVGVGLVESKEVFGMVSFLAEKLSQGFTNASVGYTIVATTLIFYFFGGFFISYLWSRILLERIFQENLDTEKRISALEENKDAQDELNELQLEYNKENAFSVIEKSLKEIKDPKRLASIFDKVIGIAYEKLDYSTINELANQYNTKINISARTWADIALANLNLYNTTGSPIYSEGVLIASDQANKILKDYGIPAMIKIYLALVEYKKGKEINDENKVRKAQEEINNIIHHILSEGTIMAYEAYNYMLRNDNTSFSEFNQMFRTEFKEQFEALKMKYLQHLPESS
ncbi:hypothetical protein [Aquimarina brevivitae]|uniref:Uncharacterized protein n=1 Tax=Aquimarina brevivitae TaxID=323412 RepID=A0A4V2F5N3_9FLAO|nr:hypothetical protein [Aquimarina brevivitae]RZS93419.1 hypothetical protein EV197_1997 [Aquimarina brevivitae]